MLITGFSNAAAYSYSDNGYHSGGPYDNVVTRPLKKKFKDYHLSEDGTYAMFTTVKHLKL